MIRLFLAAGSALLVAACAGGPSSRDEDSHREKLSQIYAEKGAAYLSEGEVKVAVMDLRKSLEFDPENASAHGTLAIVYERLDMLEEAEKHYRHAAELMPEDSAIVNNYGRFLCHQGRYAQGLELLAKAGSDKLYTERWKPLTNAGECALAAGRPEEAERYLREALDLNPNAAPTLKAMTKLQTLQGRYLSARGFLQRYEAVAQPTQETLRLGYRIESALGDRQAAQAYRERLDTFSLQKKDMDHSTSQNAKPDPTEKE
ncbi:MAG: type IV pilus biogenesis/stability protein PilW [Methylohalobius sp. ZOD2]|nr:type IV pilus biogenesis/stability protein PilW [Methylothermaceae bacterium]